MIIMKTKVLLLVAMLVMTVLTSIPVIVHGQSTSDYSVCQGMTESYWVENPAAGSAFLWTITPGTSGINWTITADNGGDIQVQWILPGTYSVQVVETNAQNCQGDPVVLNVAVVPGPTIANAGTDQVLCGVVTATLAGNTATIGTGTWTQTSGPGTITFADPGNPLTGITASVYGIYVLRWTIANAPCTDSFDEVTVTFSPKPVTSGIWHN